MNATRGYPTNDIQTNGKPDTLKILPKVQQELRAALVAQEANPTFERLGLIAYLKAKVAEYAIRAARRQP